MKTSKPIILDICCKAGGASGGYHQAGFDVVGIDKEKQKNYPFEFIQDDLRNLDPKWIRKNFDAVHASPPCQKFSRTTYQYRKRGKKYENLIPDARGLMKKSGLPSVMENVPFAPLRPDLRLTGLMFGLKVIRERWFEIEGAFMLEPPKPKPIRKGTFTGHYVSVFGSGSWCSQTKYKDEFVKPEWAKDTVRETWAFAMGVDWYMTDKELGEAIPPAYTKFIGERLIEQL